MKTLKIEEITEFLSLNLKNWSYEPTLITRDFKFNDFAEAFSFMTNVAFEAEKINHHPDWTNSYNFIKISLSTHYPEGITGLDFELAEKIDKIYRKYENSEEITLPPL